MMSIQRFLCCAAVALLLTAVGVADLCAASVTAQSEAMDQHYARGEYSEALAVAEALREQTDDPSLLYNMGSIYAKLNRIGLSILMYNRYLVHAPRDQDALYNLNYIRAQRKDLVEREVGLADALLKPHRALSRAESRMLALFFWLLVALCVALGLRRLPRWAPVVVVLLWLVTTFSWLVKERAATEMDRGVVVADAVTVRSGSGDSYTELFTLHDGAEVEVGQLKNGWVQIALSDQKRGWLQQEALELYSSQGM